jgi:hypothetical protein
MASTVADFGLSRELDDSEDNPNSEYQTQVIYVGILVLYILDFLDLCLWHVYINLCPLVWCLVTLTHVKPWEYMTNHM